MTQNQKEHSVTPMVKTPGDFKADLRQPLPKNTSVNFSYFLLEVKLLSEQLGTCTETSIYNEHVLKKAQKMISEANRLRQKATKVYEKFKGTEEIPADKIIAELQGVIRRYQEVLAKQEEMPGTVEELLAYAETLNTEFEEAIQRGEQRKCTVFMRNKEGKPIISTHMFLGNLKENLKIIVNNGDKVLNSKVAVGETMALDVKPVEKFVSPNCDVKREADGTPFLLERPICFDQMGKKVTAIALSEVVPEGAEYKVHLRVRSASPITEDILKKLLDLGKSNGMGQWRGSGGKGQYAFKLNKVDYDPTPIPDGWN